AITSDYNALSYIRLRYPRMYNFSGQASFGLTVSHLQGGLKSYLDISGFGDGSQLTPIAYDFVSHQRIRGEGTSGNARFLVANPGQLSNIYVFDSSGIQNITLLTAITFNPVNISENYEYVVVTHPLLASAADEYVAYRSQR